MTEDRAVASDRWKPAARGRRPSLWRGDPTVGHTELDEPILQVTGSRQLSLTEDPQAGGRRPDLPGLHLGDVDDGSHANAPSAGFDPGLDSGASGCTTGASMIETLSVVAVTVASLASL
jgi:hypothetical protein